MIKERKNGLHTVLDVILYGIAASIIVFLISLLLSNFYSADKYEIMAIAGIIISSIGALSLGKGNTNPPSGISNMGQSNAAYNTFRNFENTATEREITNFHSSTKNHALIYFRKCGVNALLTGIIVILVSYLLKAIF